MKYTVQVTNSLIGTLHFEGTFETAEEAEESAKTKAGRARRFATFTVVEGTPRQAGRVIGPAFIGVH